jgi:putative oxidoreductase
VALGPLTRPAAFIISGEMAFAYFISHEPRGFFLPATQRSSIASSFVA